MFGTTQKFGILNSINTCQDWDGRLGILRLVGWENPFGECHNNVPFLVIKMKINSFSVVLVHNLHGILKS